MGNSYEDWEDQDSSDNEDDGPQDRPSRRGADAGTIDSLTAVSTIEAPCGRTDSIEPQSEGDQEDGKCMICFEEFNIGEEVRSLPCFHRYHRSCADEWLRRNRTCPICKH